MKQHIYCLFVAALVCGCIQEDKAPEPQSVRIAPNVVMTLIDVNRETRTDKQIANTSIRAPFLCVQLDILDEDESAVAIVELPDFIETERPFKGYESVILRVHEHIEDQVLVDVMEAIKFEGVENISIDMCQRMSR